MRAPPNEKRAAPDAGRGGSKGSAWSRATSRKIDKPNGHSSQAQCEHCRQSLPLRKRGGAGRKQHFCSAACRVASKREKERFEGAGYNHPACYEIASKTLSKSSNCEAQNRHPYPCRFSVPVDVLGKGHRWLGAPSLDRKIIAAITWREIGGER
jgi:hypothetical protein